MAHTPIRNVPSPRGILFDMDGVLVESTEAWLRAVQEASRRFGGREVTREVFLPTFGQGAAADVETFGMQATAEELDRAYLEIFPTVAGDSIWVDPAAAPLLRSLKERGLRLSVVTNTMTPLAADILRFARLEGLFDAVVCADQVPNAKPAPDPLLEGCRRLSLTPSEVWMIGDSRFDAEAAAAAGIWFVGLRREGDQRLESLGDLETLLP
ncbi:MAG TPA: HAD-IA family hydrolase [Myxococcaceae bacterium]|nr:HAD-IA family hydrolase [Myxococcaceae bacterium]